MVFRTIRFFLLVVGLLYGRSAIMAQTLSRGLPSDNKVVSTGNLYAVVVGISDYAELKDLQFADRDATLFAQYLEKDLGVPKKHIKLFVNDEATSEAIIDEIYNIKTLVKPNDLVFIYFAGHGDIEAKLDDEALLLLHKSYPINYYKGKEYIELSKLQKWLNSIANQQARVVFIADACHSGGLIGGKEGQQKTAAVLVSDWQNQTKIVSCQANELSLEGKEWGEGRGLFSFHLVEGLQGMADDDNDKKISLFELQTYLQTQVRKQAAPNRQTPIAFGNLDQTMSIVNTQTLLALKAQKAKNYPVLASVNTKGIEEELLATTDSITRYYYGQYKVALLRKAYSVPEKKSAYYFLTQIPPNAANDDLIRLMKRNFAAALQEKALEIIKPSLEGKRIVTSIEDCELAAKELRIAQTVLGQEHYLSKMLEARALFLDQIVIDFKDKFRSYRSNLEIDNICKAILKKSLSLEPGAPYTLRNLASLYNKDSAIYFLQKYIDLVPNYEYGLFNLSKLYFEKGDYSLSLKYINDAIKLNRTEPLFYELLGNLQALMGLSDDCIISYKKCIELESLSKSAKDESYERIGRIFYTISKFDKAIEAHNLALRNNPYNLQALNNLGHILMTIDKTDEAIKMFDKVISLDSSFALTYCNLAICYYYEKNFEYAQKYFEVSIRKSPHGISYFAKGKLFNKNFETFSSNAVNYKLYNVVISESLVAYDGLTFSFIKQKKYLEAEKILISALSLDPTRGETLYNFACLYALQNQTEKSLFYLESAINKSFRDFTYIEKDTDLDNLRNLPEFKALIEKYKK